VEVLMAEAVPPCDGDLYGHERGCLKIFSPPPAAKKDNIQALFF
jgi:hypothetical protein